MGPPDLCGFTAIPAGRTDSRWLDVKDLRLDVKVTAPGRFSKAHNLVNRHLIYTSEAVDRWQSPTVAWAFEHGDCEEFALCKRAILLASGIPDEDLFFVLVNDLQRRAVHAVLIARQGDKSYLLDVPGGLVTMYPVERAKEFHPYVAFSGGGSWLYGERR